MVRARFECVGIMVAKDSMFGQFYKQAKDLANYRGEMLFLEQFYFTIELKLISPPMQCLKQVKLYFKVEDELHYLFQEIWKENESSYCWGSFRYIKWSIVEFDSLFTKLNYKWEQDVYVEDDSSFSNFKGGNTYFPNLKFHERMGLPGGFFGMTFFSDIRVVKKRKKLKRLRTV